MSRPEYGDLDMSHSMLKENDPVTPLPVGKSCSIIAPSLSLKQRDLKDETVPLIRRSRQQQREFESRVSGREPNTDSMQIVSLLYVNSKQLSSIELIHCAILNYIRVRGEVPGCLCLSSELQNDVRKDIELIYRRTFYDAIPWGVTASIPVHFFVSLCNRVS